MKTAGRERAVYGPAISTSMRQRFGRRASGIDPKNGTWVPDAIRDDQGLVINVKGKGFVVISGCAHAGIVNTVR